MDELRMIKLIRKNGDRAAADELIGRYYDEIYRFVKRQIGNADTAFDLTQEIFISCLRTISNYDPKLSASFKTWLYKIATNKTVDYFSCRCFNRNRVFRVSNIKNVIGGRQICSRYIM